jgi:hypothetical protein
VSGLSSFLLSIMMIAAFALAAGGIVTIRRGRERRKGVQMLVAAAVLLGNVLILTL